MAIPGTVTAAGVDAPTYERGEVWMPGNQKRDNTYYKERLEREHPAIYRDLVAGKYNSAREAFIAAGLKKPRSPLHELKNAWGKATTAEQRDFLRWLRARYKVATAPATSLSTTSARRTVDVDRRIENWAKVRIREIMDRRRMTHGDVMDELGFKRLNASLARALARGDRIRQEMITPLKDWLDANKAI